MRTSRLIALAGVLGAALGCGADDDPSDGAAGTFAFEAFTMDIGTLPDNGAAFGVERAAALPGEIARSEADVLCLNGVYDTPLRAALLQIGEFPYRVDLQTDESTPITDPRDANGVVPPDPTTAACIAGDEALLADALSCFAAKCSMDGRLTSGSCLYNGGCAAPHNALERSSAACHDCFHNCAEYSAYTIDETKARCTGSSRGVPRARNGRHGTMLLSKHPLSAEQRFVLPATERQVILAATVTLPNTAAVDVYCMETTAVPAAFGNMPPRYRGAYGDWAREHELQIARTIDLVRARTQSRRAVIMGDLAASPQVEEDGTIVISPDNPSGLLALENAFPQAIAADYQPSCTICGRTNSLLRYADKRWTTHIFASGIDVSSVRSTHRTFMGEVVRTADGSRPFVPLSSNYGLRSRIALEP